MLFEGIFYSERKRCYAVVLRLELPERAIVVNQELTLNKK